jgi:hypothetical protein
MPIILVRRRDRNSVAARGRMARFEGISAPPETSNTHPPTQITCRNSVSGLPLPEPSHSLRTRYRVAIPIAVAPSSPALQSNTFLAHQRGTGVGKPSDRARPRRQAKNALRYDERCFLPIHIYDTATGRPVAVILRPGKTPSGKEVRGWLRRLIKRIRQYWPKTRITIRGDGHYGREEAMSWCEVNGVDYIFGLGGNVVLDRLVEPAADDIRVPWAEGKLAALRGYAETRCAAKSWARERRVVARIETKESDQEDMLRRGIDIRYMVTSLTNGGAEYIYDTVYCGRGQAENLIEQHKAQLASDRTSCRSPIANQFRLILHTATYWLLAPVRIRKKMTEDRQ